MSRALELSAQWENVRLQQECPINRTELADAMATELRRLDSLINRNGGDFLATHRELELAHAEACGKLNQLTQQLNDERSTCAGLLHLLSDIRTAVGDHGKRMQDELVQFLHDLKEERDALLVMNLQQAKTIRGYQVAEEQA